MPLIIALIIAVIVIAIVARRTRATKGCRWREDRSGDRDTLRMYRCAACGAEAFTATPGPPRQCKAPVKPKGL
jgi:hypothetical protein